MFKNLNASALGVSGHQSEIIELALTFGFRGIDIHIDEFAARAKLHGLKYARRLLDSAGLRVGTFPLPFEPDVDEEVFKKEIEKLAQYAQVAQEAGGTRCLYTIAPANDKRPYHENFELHRRRFTEICRVLEPAGVRLGIGFRAAQELRKEQPFQFIHDFDALSLLLNMTGAPNLGFLVDIWEFQVCGASLDTVRALSPQQVVAVQLADMPADVAPSELTEQQRLVPGAGRLDIPAYLIALKDLGYDGPITLKPDRKAFESSRRDRIVKQAGEILDQLWKAAGLASDRKVSLGAGS